MKYKEKIYCSGEIEMGEKITKLKGQQGKQCAPSSQVTSRVRMKKEAFIDSLKNIRKCLLEEYEF